MRATPREFLYVGTTNSRGSEGLYVYELRRAEGILSHVQTVGDRRGPSFQALHPNGRVLYSASGQRFTEDSEHRTLSAYLINPLDGKLTLLNEVPVEGSTHLSVDPEGRFIFVSDYGGGGMSVVGIAPDGRLTGTLDAVQHEGSSVNPERQTKPYVHSAVPGIDGRFVYVSDLGVDRIFVYEVDAQTGKLTPAAMPYVATMPGSGPRHFTVHPNGRFAYSVEEMHHAVTAYSIDPASGALTPIQRVNLVPAGFDPTIYVSGADVHISPDTRFLYASNRGHDHLLIFEIDPTNGELALVGSEPTGIRPVYFAIDGRGEFVFVANNTDDNVGVYRRDTATGLLTPAGTVPIPAPTCLTHVMLD